MEYWSFIEYKSSNMLLKQAYKCDKEMHTHGNFSWFTFVAQIKHITLGSHCTESPLSGHEVTLVKARLQRRHASTWKKKLLDDNKCKSVNGKKLRTYRQFKLNYGLEEYLYQISNPLVRKELTKFRTSTHKLMIEVGRHCNINLENRLCKMCHHKVIEDEKHFLLQCPYYHKNRIVLMNKIKVISPLITNLNIADQLIWIMSCKEPAIITAVANYVAQSMKLRIEGMASVKTA